MIARRIICYCNNGLYCVLLMSVWVKAGQWEGWGEEGAVDWKEVCHFGSFKKLLCAPH